MVEKKRKELFEVYQKWENELKQSCPKLITEEFSHPYYLHIPDKWYESQYRILIVGEEGHGEKEFDLTIEKAQEFNRDFLLDQINNEGKHSPFWRRIWRIAESMKDKGYSYSITWTNLDMIHHNGTKGCALTAKERNALHSTDIKILSKEIDILRPTHVIYFGWYFVSVRAELQDGHSEVFKHLYPSEKRGDNSQWGKDKMTKYQECQENGNRLWHIFTYHPGWRRKPKDYEDKVLNQISRTLTQG